jgi:hypothetical protein
VRGISGCEGHEHLSTGSLLLDVLMQGQARVPSINSQHESYQLNGAERSELMLFFHLMKNLSDQMQEKWIIGYQRA